MSILDTEVPTKITREYLAKNGWCPDKLGRNWTIQLVGPSKTNRHCYFKYTLRDPNKRIRNQLKCNGWYTNMIYSNIKEISDLNVAISCFINQESNYIFVK